MNYLDIALIIPLVYGLIQGFSRGIVREITSLVSLVIGVYVAINFSFYLESYLEDLISEHKNLIPIISFAVVFAGALIIIKILGSLLEKITNALALGIISKILGSVFGALKIAVFLAVLLFFEKKIELIPEEVSKTSLLIQPLEKILVVIIPKITEHKDIIKDIEKKAKKATDKIKEGL
jgi:membrane protein required for colicin V production